MRRRYFNTEGQCEPDRHYMVRLDERLKKIKERYVDMGSYLVINRGRQYGKTTTLRALAEYLRRDYAVILLDFQKMGNANFKDESAFVRAFIRQIEEIYEYDGNLTANIEGEAFGTFTAIKEDASVTMDQLFFGISRLCRQSENPVVLLIDEVDSASGNQVFINFLSMLRGYYLDRKNKEIFHSVILTGVYDIKNLKLKLRSDSEHQYNSPWNIAVKFNMDMSFSAVQIADMLREYEDDHHTGMEIDSVSACIYDYTSGYPYLVSAICKLLDEELTETAEFSDGKNLWAREGIAEAVKIILNEPAPLFESMVRQLTEYPDMKKMLREILFQGKRLSYNVDTTEISLASMFGYIKNDKGSIQVANRIFEMRLYNLFLSEEELTNTMG